MQRKENYDPNQPVCGNQADFNIAFRKAVKNDIEQKMDKAGAWLYVSAVVLLIFLVWAILLAMQVPPGPERVEHLVFAIVFSPIYVLAYYLGVMGDGKSGRFGMCGCNAK